MKEQHVRQWDTTISELVSYGSRVKRGLWVESMKSWNTAGIGKVRPSRSPKPCGQHQFSTKILSALPMLVNRPFF
jgi:hypothetical protein